MTTTWYEIESYKAARWQELKERRQSGEYEDSVQREGSTSEIEKLYAVIAAEAEAYRVAAAQQSELHRIVRRYRKYGPLYWLYDVTSRLYAKARGALTVRSSSDA